MANVASRKAAPSGKTGFLGQAAGMWRRLRWTVVGVTWLVVVALGYAGFALHYAETGRQAAPLGILYVTLQLFVLESGGIIEPVNWMLDVARLAAPALAAYAAIQGLAVLFAEQIQATRACLLKEHAIVCGLGDRGLRAALALREAGYRIAAIERDPTNEGIAECSRNGISVLIGDASGRDMLEAVRADRARYLIAVCGDDGANAEIGIQARAISTKRKSGVLTCSIHVTDAHLAHLLQEVEVSRSKTSRCRLEFYDVYERGATALLNTYDPSRGDDLAPHLLVIGLGRMGRSVVTQAAKRWRQGASQTRLSVTVVDREATRLCDELGADEPAIERYAELRPLEVDARSARFADVDATDLMAGENPVTWACVCIDDDATSLSAALGLARASRSRGIDFPIIARMAGASGLAQLIADSDAAPDGFPQVSVFSLLDETCQPQQLLGGITETIAQAAHEEYLRTALASGRKLGEMPALCPWAELDEEYREANRRQADGIADRLQAYGYRLARLTDWDADRFTFRPDEVEGMSRIEHDRWCDERRAAGWRHGAERDDGRKLHPDLVPWEDLSEDAREKNRSAVVGLPAFLARAGLQIERVP